MGIDIIKSWRFLSTPSARRATNLYGFVRNFCVISIHALREEGDDIQAREKSRHDNFYPRPPRGGRLEKSQDF